MDWWDAFWAAVTGSVNGPNVVPAPTPGSITNWISGLGGEIASGLESAFVAGVRDLWDVVIGPFEVVLGLAIFLVGVFLMFNNDLVGLAGLIR